MGIDPSHWRGRLTRRVDGASLGAFRAILGALLAAGMTRYFLNGWIEAQFIAPRVHFPYEGLEWIRPLPPAGMYTLFGALLALAVLIAAGLWSRPALALFCAGFTWVHLIDKSNYLNHYYLISLLTLVLAFLPVEAALTVRRRTGATVPLWCLYLLRFQAGIVYFYAGVAKLNTDWLCRGEPLRKWLFHADLPQEWTVWLAHPAVAVALAWAGAAFDLAVPFLLLVRRVRAAAFFVLVVFHALTAALFPIGLFPWYMTALATVFLPASWPRLVPLLRTLAGPPPPAPAAARPLSAWAAAAVGAYMLVQVLTPLRHWLYPGDVLWTEEGFRWSWRVVLVEKLGDVAFHVRRPDTGEEWDVRPRDVLTPEQERAMSTQPDMIQQLAVWIRDDFARRGAAGCEVRARACVSWWPRPGAPLIDPAVDLSAQPRGLRPKPWILPPP